MGIRKLIEKKATEKLYHEIDTCSTSNFDIKTHY